jgi:hypothetical protein
LFLAPLSRGRASQNREKSTRNNFLNEVHEVNKIHLFLRVLRALRGGNLPFSNKFSLGKQSTVLKAQAAK